MNEDIVFKNEIDNKQLKENLGDAAIAVLTNLKLIKLPKDLNHLIVEFGYLLVKPDGKICTMCY